MKQGTLINRIVMLLLLAAVLVYLGVSAWRSFRDPYTLVLSYAYTVDDSLEATGFLVREERVLASPGGIVDLLPEEGEKVSRGETVALLYQNDSGLARKEELQSLTMEKEQLQYALERTQSGGDSSQAQPAGDRRHRGPALLGVHRGSHPAGGRDPAAQEPGLQAGLYLQRRGRGRRCRRRHPVLH